MTYKILKNKILAQFLYQMITNKNYRISNSLDEYTLYMYCSHNLIIKTFQRYQRNVNLKSKYI